MSKRNESNDAAAKSAPSITGHSQIDAQKLFAKMKSGAWSITINNPTQDDINRWRDAKTQHWVKEAKGQLEKGENGTPYSRSVKD